MKIGKVLENQEFFPDGLRSLELPRALFSQLLHLATFPIERPKLQLSKAMLIFSVDIDAGTKELGVINAGKNDRNVHDYINECKIGELEEQGLPLLLDIFNSFKVPVTFAIRGQLMEVDNSFLPLLLDSPIKHDIGSHGYTHRNFQDLSREEAEAELNMLSVGMNRYNIVPKSFIFPRNAVSHLELLEKFGYECYREIGNFLSDGMYIQRKGLLYDVHPSLYITKNAKVRVLRALLNIAIEKKTSFHLWCHIWSFGETVAEIKEKIVNVLVPFLKYAKEGEEKRLLQFDTMLSASRKARKSL
jgi:peptidoglycan/xylan/chitin deacetylase (PgdA/CDA1 family)